MSAPTLTNPGPAPAGPANPAPAPKGPSPRGLSLRAFAKVTACQHRWTVVAALGVAVVAAAVLLAAVYMSDHATDVLKAAGCVKDTHDPDCYQPAREYFDAQLFASHLPEYVGLGVILLPAVIAGYMAGPLVARELETGTYKLAWTQSASPARWLAAKLAVAAAFTVALMVVVNLAFGWSWPNGSIDDYAGFWYDPTVYASLPGTVPVATTLFGVALGAFLGLLIRRTLPALLTSTLLTGGVILAFVKYRHLLWPTETLTGQAARHRPTSSWDVELGILTPSGRKVSMADCHWDAACLKQQGGVTDYADIHPQSHFWPLQLVETGILLALAALAVLAAFRVLRSRLP
ncbi:hypothetical protein ABZ990_29760 [Streptomyces sp. NPDC046203]|uniref:hypothetical protein n=1 Tax=Streptomyces sp. NPDC046203 TaxID=3154602 RepID=UPI0033D79B83